jgi:lipoprotein-anchoring transpeptidase ErfK/SrfK
MVRRNLAILVALTAMVVLSSIPAQAQGYYPDQPYSRGARPHDAYVPPPGAPSGPQSVLPYPQEADEELPPPGFAPPYTGSFGGRPSGPPTAQTDPNMVRPPAPVGAAPRATPQPVPPATTAALPPEDQPEQGQPKELSPELRRQMVDYPSQQPPGTIIIDTPHTFLYLVLGHGKALRYGIGVGREGFTWSGTERVSKMKEWPDWFPPPEMIERQPYLPRMMAGGPGNPLGARALYLGNTLYRIHGTNQPSTIGTFVSSGCIRLLNTDIEDLYDRVQVGSRVVVLPGSPPKTAANSAAPEQPANPMAPPAQRPGAAVSASPLPAPR